MKDSRYFDIIDNMLTDIKDVIITKKKEYVLTEDNLRAFKLLWLDSNKNGKKQVLWGYMVKHLNSLNEMCTYIPDDNDFMYADMYAEKIRDTIIYLLILMCIVEESVDDCSSELE